MYEVIYLRKIDSKACREKKFDLEINKHIAIRGLPDVSRN